MDADLPRTIKRIFRNLMAVMLLTAGAGAADAGNGRAGGKLLLTDGIASVEGTGGGGLASWAVITGRETKDGIGGGAHATVVALPEFDLTSYGAAIGLYDRVELSYAHQNLDTRRAGAALGLGRGFILSQDIIGAKVRLVGDAVWAQDTPMPQIAVGVQHKIAAQGAVIRAVGGRQSTGTDFYISATKVFLAQSLVAGATLRFTKANQFGLLGFGGDRSNRHSAQVEGSVGALLSPSILVGAEYRTKPDNLGFARENDAYDLFAAWAVHRNVTLTAAYADVGDIATVRAQRGALFSIKAGF